MKHLKKYEQTFDYSKDSTFFMLASNKPKYNIGDTVVYIKSSGSLKYGKKYTIKNIIFNKVYYVKLEEKIGEFYASKFIPVLDFDTNKYNL